MTTDVTTVLADDGPASISLTLDETIQLAVRAINDGHHDYADHVLGSVLTALPGNALAMNFLGVLRFEQQRLDEADALMQRSVEIAPDAPHLWNNYGNVLLARGRKDEATDAFRRCVELDPGNFGAYNNLGRLHRSRHNFDLSRAAYEKALALSPGNPDVLHNLGVLYVRWNKHHEAANCFLRSFTARPENAENLEMLGTCYGALGELEKARDVYRHWVRLEPDNPIARHHLASVGGEGTPARASNGYVKTVFDRFAASFDHKLASLDYKAPDLVREELASALPQDADLAVIDAGCGTGLCAAFLRGYAKHLVGVDLSAEMLARAAERKVYDALAEAELTAFLEARPGSADLIVSADTLCYFGSLIEPMSAAFGCLKSGGRLIFTVERHADRGEAYMLNPNGRYVHGERYVAQCLADGGFVTIAIRDAMLRYETGKPVDGYLVHAVKP